MIIEYIGLAESVADGYTVFFPDFPGLGSAGRTLEDARKNAREALIAHVELMVEDNERLPKATSLNNTMKLPEAKHSIPLITPLIPPCGKAQRVNITLDRALLKAIDAAASTQHKTRSGLIAEAAQRLLGELS